MSELLMPVMPEQLKTLVDIDETSDRFSLLRAQEGGAILRRYNASLAAVRAGLQKVPARCRDTTTAATQAYMKVAHDLWNQMLECEKDFGRARRLQMDAQMRFAQSSKSLVSKNAKMGFMKRLFSSNNESEESRLMSLESANALRSAMDQQTDALMKHHFLHGEFERTLNEMAQIVQQHTMSGRDREARGDEDKSPVDQLLPAETNNHPEKLPQNRKNRSPIH